MKELDRVRIIHISSGPEEFRGQADFASRQETIPLVHLFTLSRLNADAVPFEPTRQFSA